MVSLTVSALRTRGGMRRAILRIGNDSPGQTRKEQDPVPGRPMMIPNDCRRSNLEKLDSAHLPPPALDATAGAQTQDYQHKAPCAITGYCS